MKREKYVLNENVMVNCIENQGVLFVVDGDKECVFYLNDTSLAVVNYLNTECGSNLEGIIEEIMSHFDVDKEMCAEDITRLMDEMCKLNIAKKINVD